MGKGYLCVMLDCSRNAVMSVDGVKDFIDQLSAMGYNSLMLYTEDTYEIPEEPLFGYMRGRYTQKELKTIDAYAKARGIELIPCIQTLAHLDQIFPWKRFQRIQDLYNVLLVGEEETYEFIDKMFASCAECFTSRRINIGMDEAHMLGLGKYLDRNGYHTRSEILLAHLKRVCAIAEKYGFKPMMWSDMFFKLGTSLGKYSEDCEVSREAIDSVPENIELVYWDYTPTEVDESPMIWSTSKYFHKTFVRAGGYSLEFDTNGDPHYDASGLGRVHKKGAPSTVCLSVPFAKAPYYYGGKRVNPTEISMCLAGKQVNSTPFSICPAIRSENGEWLYGADRQTQYVLVASNSGNGKSELVFKCIFASGKEVDFSCLVEENGVFLEAGSGEIYFNAYRIETENGKYIHGEFLLYALNPTMRGKFHTPARYVWLKEYL